ncbi:M23 family metallopeptidase [Sinorhizobium meliloti]|uniref:M23 family metallopeptidase n=1 Tax=Rhizobium meliloti TaxID=382 RepID=UPI003F155E01
MPATSSHLALLRALDQLAPLNDNAVLRRIASLVLEQAGVSDPDVATAFAQDFGGEFRQGGPVHRALRCGGVTLVPDADYKAELMWDSVQEFTADDRRRSVFLDPKEAILVGFKDLYLGRLSAIEFRGVSMPELRLLEDDAKRQLRGKISAISIVPELFSSRREIIHALRALADELQRMEGETVRSSEDPDGFGATDPGSCMSYRESRGGRFINGGKEYVSSFVEMERCCGHDRCCGNSGCSTRQTASWESVTWRDGDLRNPPPALPERFVPRPWNNRLPLFSAPNVGTQSSDWGWRRITRNGAEIADFHGGIDITAPAGSRVWCVDAGVIAAIYRSADGNSGVIVQIGSQTHTYYHIVPASGLRVGQPIGVGDQVGTVMDLGENTHLHYAIHNPPDGDYNRRDDSNSVDPLP